MAFGVGADGILASASTDRLAVPTIGVQLQPGDLQLISTASRPWAYLPGQRLPPRSEGTSCSSDRLAAAAKSLETDTHTDAREPATAQ